MIGQRLKVEILGVSRLRDGLATDTNNNNVTFDARIEGFLPPLRLPPISVKIFVRQNDVLVREEEIRSRIRQARGLRIHSRMRVEPAPEPQLRVMGNDFFKTELSKVLGRMISKLFDTAIMVRPGGSDRSIAFGFFD